MKANESISTLALKNLFQSTEQTANEPAPDIQTYDKYDTSYNEDSFEIETETDHINPDEFEVETINHNNDNDHELISDSQQHQFVVNNETSHNEDTITSKADSTPTPINNTQETPVKTLDNLPTPIASTKPIMLDSSATDLSRDNNHTHITFKHNHHHNIINNTNSAEQDNDVNGSGQVVVTKGINDSGVCDKNKDIDDDCLLHKEKECEQLANIDKEIMVLNNNSDHHENSDWVVDEQNWDDTLDLSVNNISNLNDTFNLEFDPDNIPSPTPLKIGTSQLRDSHQNISKSPKNIRNEGQAFLENLQNKTSTPTIQPPAPNFNFESVKHEIFNIIKTAGLSDYSQKGNPLNHPHYLPIHSITTIISTLYHIDITEWQHHSHPATKSEPAAWIKMNTPPKPVMMSEENIRRISDITKTIEQVNKDLDGLFTACNHNIYDINNDDGYISNSAHKYKSDWFSDYKANFGSKHYGTPKIDKLERLQQVSNLFRLICMV